MRKSIINYGDTVAQAKELIKAGTPLICFDLETTGLSPVEERILSFSAIKCQYKNGLFEEIDRKDIFINPGRPISPAVTSINHIDNDRVKDCPTEDIAIHEIRKFMGDNPFVCGYNSTKFDEAFMKNLYLRTLGEDFKPILHVDVLLMAREQIQTPSHKLSDIAHLLGVDRNLEFHNSLDDVLATFWIFRLLLNEYSDVQETRPMFKLSVKGANWYEMSHRVKRIYISTYPYSKTYYDIYKGEWVSDTDGFDMDKMIRDVFKLYGVENIKDFVKVLSAKKKAARA